MALDFGFFILGLVLAGLTLRDVFDTVVVPGGGRASLRVTQRISFVLLPLWKRLRGRRGGVSGTFAPLVLVSSFVIWMSLLALSFGLMAYAVRADFAPPVKSFGEAVYVVGSSLVTVGLSHNFPHGAGRWIVLGAGFCGLAVMTMAVTYLLEVQSSIARRDTGIIKQNTSAGEPPSAMTLLERFAAINYRSELSEVLREGRDWCATVRQSHCAHPTLIYFSSINTGSGWPAALGALLDLGLIAEHCLDDDALYGPAVLLQVEGTRMAHEVAALAKLEPKVVTTDGAELRDAVQRLGRAGYPMRSSPDFTVMARKRAEYLGCVNAIAAHLGKPCAVLLAD